MTASPEAPAPAGDSLPGPETSGLYLAPEDTRPFRSLAAKAKLGWHDINLARVTTKQEFLAACANRLRFPRSFGANWDALADCLKDFCGDSVICCRNCDLFASHAPDDFATALEVLEDASEYWRDRRLTFIVLLDVEPEEGLLPRLSAPGGGR